MFLTFKKWTALYILCLLGLFVIFGAILWRGSAVNVSRSNIVLTPDTPVLIIDAGHGGEDGGAVSGDGTPEAGINLSIALQMRDGSTRVLRMSQALERHLRREWTPYLLGQPEGIVTPAVTPQLLAQIGLVEMEKVCDNSHNILTQHIIPVSWRAEQFAEHIPKPVFYSVLCEYMELSCPPLGKLSQ